MRVTLVVLIACCSLYWSESLLLERRDPEPSTIHALDDKLFNILYMTIYRTSARIWLKKYRGNVDK